MPDATESASTKPSAGSTQRRLKRETPDQHTASLYGLLGGVVPPAGRAAKISLEIQTAILEHRLSPGEKLPEDEVGDAFGASRTIARAALHALAHSGLVTIERNRGAFVSKPTRREANEVFEARALIEPRVARMAAELATDEAIAGLRQHVEMEHRALAAGDAGRALSLSGLFHIKIADIADQQVLKTIVGALIARSSLIIALFWMRRDATCEKHSHHALIEALARRDAADAEATMHSHLVDLRSGLDLAEKAAARKSLAEKLARP